MTPTSTGALHPRSRHQGRYDFGTLVQDTPELEPFVVTTPAGQASIDFANPAAVRMLNRALLKTHYGLAHWDLPANYLCPPIPGRADYIHHLADLLADDNSNIPMQGASVRVLDIGVGASCIYPLLGHREYGWHFLGSDIDPIALSAAKTIVQANQLTQAIELRQQRQQNHILTGLLARGESFELTLCNPPFHASPEAAQNGTQRKWRGLKKTHASHTPVLNFGGRNNELWCEGGEAGFIRQMIEESVPLHGRILWFSTLVSSASNLQGISRALKQAQAVNVRTIEMAQGQKQSRFVAWTFHEPRARREWLRGRSHG